MTRAVSRRNLVRAVRGSTLSRVRKVAERNPGLVGPKLAICAYSANIPPAMLAAIIGVSEPTIFRWYFGDAVRKYLKRV